MSSNGLSPGLMIVLTHDGLKMAPDAAGFGHLGVADLLLLVELASGTPPSSELVARVAGATGASEERLNSLVAALRTQELLVDRTDLPAPDTAEVAAPESGSIASSSSVGDHLVVPTPVVLRLGPAGYENLDHYGRVSLRLGPIELAATSEFKKPVSVAEAFDHHRKAAGANALDRPAFEAVVDALERIGLGHRIASGGARGADTMGRSEREWRKAIENLQRVASAVERRSAEREAELRSTGNRAGLDRIKLFGVHPHGPCPSLAIGMVLAYARAYDGGRLEERFDFFPRWILTDDRVPSFTTEPGIFLFSNYLWSTEHNLEISAQVKRLSPGSITIHGGPDTPKYDVDVRRFFADNPQVDIAVRGEGEATMAGILEALFDVRLGDEVPDLTPLRNVPGLCFRLGNEVVRTADRDRITDVDTIPSPYLAGFLEAYGEASESTAVIETNRGCPYGCTFCDWGSATLSRIRKFDLDRIFGELEWCAQHGVARVWLADANFGIFERDVAIAEKVAELKAIYGYPKEFSTNYAKNTIKHLKPIVKVMADAGILTEGLLSLQSMDESTLDTIKRSNIKLEKYEELAREFRAANLPLYVDLMVGLPGATLSSFRDDLQECLEREVSARIFSTTMLVNSPMNEPAYREKHQIETEVVLGSMKQNLVVSTATFTRADHDAMLKLREIYIMCENHGMLRQVSRFVRREAGVREVDLYETLWRVSRADRDRYPAMAFVFESGPSLMVAPASWQLFMNEVRTYLTEEIGLPDDDALESVIQVQLGLLPSRNRQFPEVLELPCDFGAWHAAMIAAKDDGHTGDWPAFTPRLRDMPPGHFPIDDPNQVCILNMGYHVEGDIYSDWELRSPVARSMPATHLVT
jgi:radical SAM superfamily enzyme YgiQ (UPF0313 family)